MHPCATSLPEVSRLPRCHLFSQLCSRNFISQSPICLRDHRSTASAMVPHINQRQDTLCGGAYHTGRTSHTSTVQVTNAFMPIPHPHVHLSPLIHHPHGNSNDEYEYRADDDDFEVDYSYKSWLFSRGVDTLHTLDNDVPSEFCSCESWKIKTLYFDNCRCSECLARRSALRLCTLWERWGLVHDMFESSFLTNKRFRRLSSDRNLNYDRCSAKELQRAVQSRGLTNPYPAGLTLKYSYIRILEKADREANFRFLDLPAEMRDMVYDKLLRLDAGRCARHAFCFPQILATCRLINEEATEILYKEAKVVCKFWAWADDTDPWKIDTVTWRIHRSIYMGEEAECRELILGLDKISKSQHFLRRIQNLKISIDLEDEMSIGFGAGADFLNSCLLALSSFLMDDHVLQRLEIDYFRDLGDLLKGSTTDVYIAEAIFYPLRRLRGVPRVEFGADFPGKLAYSLLHDLRRSDQVFNTLRHASLLLQEANALQCLVDELANAREAKVCHSAYFATIEFIENEYPTDGYCSFYGIDDELGFQDMLALAHIVLDEHPRKYLRGVAWDLPEAHERRKYIEEMNDWTIGMNLTPFDVEDYLKEIRDLFSPADTE